MGLNGPGFTKKYENLVIEMQRSFLEFMKACRARMTIIAEEEKDTGAIMTDDGFPILCPEVLEPTMKKRTGEDLLRGYLSQHYCESISGIYSPVIV